MTPEAFIERVEDENRTALSRLGSSKSLYAETQGEMAAGTVLAAAADAEYHAAETYRTWAAEETNAEAKTAWATTADEEATHYDRVTAEIEGEHEPSGPPAIQRELREMTDPVERAGGFLGRTLAADRSKSQVTGFFVGQAEPGLASLFRDFGDDLDAQRDRALDVLHAVCTDETDWDRAMEAATTAIQAAYDEYVETLEGMGVDPKPVC
ncbi:MAG: rubrerythrin family protein [Halobacteriaceae archaeon]